MKNLLQRQLKRFLRFMLTALFAGAGITLALALVHLPVKWRNNGTIMPLGLGFGVGLLFFTLISRFLVLYVFGHELTHYVMAKVFRRETGRFRLGTASGSIAIERPNIWITLAPYFIPVYTLLWIGLHGVISFLWHQPAAWLPQVFAAGVGVTYAFHVRLTLYALARQQSDLRYYGRALSLSFIAFCNILLLYFGTIGATGNWQYSIKAIERSTRQEWEVIKMTSYHLHKWWEHKGREPAGGTH